MPQAIEIVPIEFASFHDQTFRSEYLQFICVTIFAWTDRRLSPAHWGFYCSSAGRLGYRGARRWATSPSSRRARSEKCCSPSIRSSRWYAGCRCRLQRFPDHRGSSCSTRSRAAFCHRLLAPAPYVSVMDNHRVQAWRLILRPGEVAAPMQQAAPGVRIVVQGGGWSRACRGSRTASST